MIADWVPFAAAAGGFLAGRIGRRKRSTPSDPEPICPCGHSIAYHEEGTGVCHEEEHRGRYNKYGDWTGYDYVPCACRHYSGPELISSVTMQPISYREVTTDRPEIPR